MTDEKHHVFLIPGFFGFANFGDFKYFAHVHEHLAASLRIRGIEPIMHDAPTVPTASLRRRAGRLAEIVYDAAGNDDLPIHLVGHSTGGLDARLFSALGTSLATHVDPRPLAKRVRTVVSVATPHRGTPAAAFFTSLLGQRLLQILSLTTISAIRLGSIPLPALVALVGLITRSTGLMERASGGILDQVYRQVLKDFTADRREEIERFFAEVSGDQALMPQLSPEGMDLFNGAVTDRPGVRYGCVVARARPPSLRTQAKVGIDPVQQASYSLYRALHELSADQPAWAVPILEPAQEDALRQAFGDVPDSRDNDAMVPATSQVHDAVVHATWADHLDVIGHFDDRDHRPLHVDWLRTMSKFRRPAFERLWSDVAAFMAAPPPR